MIRVTTSHLFFGLGMSLASIAAGCVDDPQTSERNDEIVGGTATTIAQVPWQVALTTNSGFQFCGGSILNASWVLTAQHCVADGSSDMRVVAGVTRISQSSSGQIRRSTRSPGTRDSPIRPSGTTSRWSTSPRRSTCREPTPSRLRW